MATRLFVSALAMILMVSGVGLSDASAAYPGRDGKIAFTRANQIYSINPDGSAVKQLTTSGKNYRPRYSPSGTEIAYIHETVDGYRDIWVMRANGTNKRAVTHLGNVTGPSWSPDGQSIAFGGGQDLVLQTTTRSTGDVWNSPQPVWAYVCDEALPMTTMPVTGAVAWGQGNRIAFTSDNSCDSPDWGMAVVDLDTFTPTVEIVDDIGGSCCGLGRFEDPSWSPDGTRLAYSLLDQRNFRDRPIPDEVKVKPFAGAELWPGKLHDKQPAFSPLGTRMVVTNTKSGTSRLVVLDATDGSGRQFVTNGYQADWQPRP